MNRFAAVFLFGGILAATSLCAEEKPLPKWTRSLPLLRPGSFQPLPPGKAEYRFGWAGLTAAKGTLRMEPSTPTEARMELEASTTGMARTLWSMDATAFSICNPVTLEPIRLRQVEKYGPRRTVVAAQEYRSGSVLRTRGRLSGPLPAEFQQNAPTDKETLRKWSGNRARTFRFPQIFDLQSALRMIRSQPLAVGEVHHLVVMQGSTPYLATIKVHAREKITVAAGTFPALRMDLRLQEVRKDYSLKPHGTFKSATGWFSDDARRLPLRIEAQIMIGTVWAELERFVPAASGGASGGLP